jgi:hypothetical protein
MFQVKPMANLRAFNNANFHDIFYDESRKMAESPSIVYVGNQGPRWPCRTTVPGNSTAL